MKAVGIEKIAETQKAAADLTLSLFQKTLDGIEQLTNVNLERGRSLLTAASTNAKEMMAAKNVGEAAQITSTHLQPQVEGWVGYSYDVYETITKLQDDVRSLLQSQAKWLSESALSSLSSLEVNHIPGADSLGKSVKSMLDASQKTLDNLNAATKQFSEIAETNFKTLSRLGQPAPVEKKASSKKTAAAAA